MPGYEYLAYITSAVVDGSESADVESDQADGVIILIYAQTEFLGQHAILDKQAVVPFSRPVVKGEILSSFVGEFGEKAGPPVLVTDAETSLSGWLLPTTVNGQPYEEYLEANNVALPAIYDPVLSKANRVAQIRNEVIITNRLGVILELREQYGIDNIPQVKATVLSVSGLLGGAIYYFDDDAPSNINTKIYSVAGTQSLSVVDDATDLEDPDNFVTVPFEVVLPSEIPPPTGLNENILNVGWSPDPEKSILLVSVIANAICEISIDGLAAFANTGTQWAQCSARRYWDDWIDQSVIVSGIPHGDLTMRVRLISDTSQEVAISVHL